MTSTIATNTTNNTIILQSVDMLLNSTRRYTNCYRKNFSCDLRILYYKFKNFGNSRINIFLTTFLTTFPTTLISSIIRANIYVFYSINIKLPVLPQLHAPGTQNGYLLSCAKLTYRKGSKFSLLYIIFQRLELKNLKPYISILQRRYTFLN